MIIIIGPKECPLLMNMSIMINKFLLMKVIKLLINKKIKKKPKNIVVI